MISGFGDREKNLILLKSINHYKPPNSSHETLQLKMVPLKQLSFSWKTK